MSWRRFNILYQGLSRYGAVASHYERLAKREGVQNESAEAAMWAAVTALGKPGDVEDGQVNA
jgi:hypothetical protein